MITPEQRSAYWLAHYSRQHAVADTGSARRLEYSNDRVQLQTYAHVLDAAGSVAGRRVLDAGCGLGALSLCLHAVGARVTAIDGVETTVRSLAAQYPFVEWIPADLHARGELSRLGSFDLIVSVEVFQYVNVNEVVPSLWDRINGGGRLVFSVPNAVCPIVRRVRTEQGAFWQPLSEGDIIGVAARLPSLQLCAFKGLSFVEDQHFVPYAASPWSKSVVGTPNRLICAFLKN